MKTEITIDGADSASASYVAWAPVHSSIRLVEPDEDVDFVDVVLRNQHENQGGQIVFLDAIPGEGQDRLRIRLSADGTPLDFFIAGKPGRPSQQDKDAVLETVEADTEVVLSTKALMVRIRKNANDLTAGERDRFLSAFAILNNQGMGRFRDFRDMHRDNTSIEAHGRAGFLPWHRAYLLDLERELQAIDPSVTVPYWRFDQPAPRVFSRSFMGSTESAAGTVIFTASNPLSLFATDGQLGIVRLPFFDTRTQAAANFNGPVVAEQPVVQSQLPYTRLRPPLENNPHGRAHTSFTVGFISQIGTAVRDPLFFLLHANVDRLWAKWQWFNKRFDPTVQTSYFFRSRAGTAGAERIGHNALDTMWPWNDVRTNPRPQTAPRTPFPISELTAAPGAAPTVASMIDYQGVISPANQLGFDYDDVPFES